MAYTVLLIMKPSRLRECTADGLLERCIEVEVRDVADGWDSPPIDAARHAGVDVAVVELPATHAEPGEVCAKMRESGLPGVIALGDSGSPIGAVEALQAGADDYLPRPLSPLELIARIRALLRRLNEYRGGSSGLIDLGQIVVDCDSYRVMVRGEDVALTPKEFELLRELARNPGALLPRAELLRSVWGFDETIISRTLDVHIGRLRKKIECDPACPDLIQTVPRVGYRLAA